MTYSDGTNDLAVTGGSNYTTPAGSGLSKRFFDVTTTLDSSLYFQNDAGTNVLGVPQTTVWFSFLAKTDSNPSGGNFFTQLYEEPRDTSRNRERTAAMGSLGLGQTGDIDQWAFYDIGNPNGTGSFLDVDLGNNTGQLVTTNTVFYVARIDYGGNAGDDPYDLSLVSTTINIWLNPDLGTEPSTATAEGQNINVSTGAVFNGIAMGSYGGGGNWDEFRFGTTYASVAPIAGPPPTNGDFDNDGDTDGADFLLWQRDMSVGSLADWEAGFGTTPLSAIAAAVPEPTSLILAIFASLGLTFSSRKRIS